jgi:hypothetical protein
VRWRRSWLFGRRNAFRWKENKMSLTIGERLWETGFSRALVKKNHLKICETTKKMVLYCLILLIATQYDSETQVMKTIKAIDVSGKGNHEFEEGLYYYYSFIKDNFTYLYFAGDGDNVSDHENGMDLNIQIGSVLSVKVENGIADGDSEDIGQSETLRLEGSKL